MRKLYWNTARPVPPPAAITSPVIAPDLAEAFLRPPMLPDRLAGSPPVLMIRPQPLRRM